MMCLWKQMMTLSRITVFLHVATTLSSWLLLQQQQQQQQQPSPHHQQQHKSWMVHGHPPTTTASVKYGSHWHRYFMAQMSKQDKTVDKKTTYDTRDYPSQSYHNNHHQFVSFGRIAFPSSSLPTSSILSSSFGSVSAYLRRHRFFGTIQERQLQQQQHYSNNDRPNRTKILATSSSSQPEPTETATTSIPVTSIQKTRNEEEEEENDNADIFFLDNDLSQLNEEYYTSALANSRRRTYSKGTTNDIILESATKTSTCYTTDINDTSDPIQDPSTIQNVIRIKVPKKQSNKRKKESKLTTGQESDVHNDSHRSSVSIESLTQPLMTERVWNHLTGTEWCSTSSSTAKTMHTIEGTDTMEQEQHVQLLNSLAQMGEEVARIDTPTKWIDWHPYGSSNNNNNNNNDSSSLMDGSTVHVWTGKCIATPPPYNVEGNNDEQDRYYGIQLPFIKTRAILPHSIHDVVDLLLDSKKVVTYNPWSLGRRDCWIDRITTVMIPDAITKIVQNRVQPPIPGARPVVSTTLLHARPLHTTTTMNESDESTSWIIVSRSVGCNHSYIEESDQGKATSRSDILLGVNLLEPVRSADGVIDPKSCMITAVTHVYSPSVPLALAERLGVQSAIKFIQDVRNVKTSSTTETPLTTATAVSAAESTESTNAKNPVMQ